MDNATALQRFEQSPRRRFPDRITPCRPVAEGRRRQVGEGVVEVHQTRQTQIAS